MRPLDELLSLRSRRLECLARDFFFFCPLDACSHGAGSRRRTLMLASSLLVRLLSAGGFEHTSTCLTFLASKGSTYKGRCAHCGVTRSHKNFKSRRQGCPIPVDFCLCLGTADHLKFLRLDPKIDRLCSKCDRKGRDEDMGAKQS